MSKKTLITFFIGLIIGSVSFSYAAWTAPTDTPPNGNVAAPINVSNLAQDKAGVLTTGGLGVFGSALITSTAGYKLPTTLQLGVNGKVGATAYCDQNGNNCVATLGGGGGASVGTGGTDWKDISLSDTSDYNLSCDYKFYVDKQFPSDWNISEASGSTVFQGTYIVNKAIGWQEYNIMYVVPSKHKDHLWAYWLHGEGLDTGIPVTRLQEKC
ncbi:MAG: hypothetical protein V4509_02150 [Patescibacteria group bacterium]